MWDNTILIIVEERFVLLKHPENNYRMVKETLLNKISISKENLIYLKHDHKNCVDEFEKTIRTTLHLQKDEFPQFDLVMLGLGEDGDTATLFLNDASLKEQTVIATKVLVSENEYNECMLLTITTSNIASKVI